MLIIVPIYADRVIYVNLAVENQLHDFEELVLSNSLRFGTVNYCRKERLEEFCNSKETILIIDEIQESSIDVYKRQVQGGCLNKQASS